MIDEEIKETDSSLTEETSGEENVDSEQAVDDSLNDIEQRAKSIAFNSPDGFLAFGFGSGLLTKAPGTMGTLAAVPIAILLSYFNLIGFSFLLFTFVLGVIVCGNASKKLGVEDYGGIVWDEMMAYWLVVAFVPLHWGWFLAAFVIFRGFDILKPWPISLLEESFGGGFGIMIDDVLAAVYTIIILSFVEQYIIGF
jgi:phosphatidylglycerophosphatase A